MPETCPYFHGTGTCEGNRGCSTYMEPRCITQPYDPEDNVTRCDEGHPVEIEDMQEYLASDPPDAELAAVLSGGYRDCESCKEVAGETTSTPTEEKP